jgi:hippurate hydrolase
MPTIKELDALKPAMTKWRHALHQKPEIAFEEEWTSDYIAEKLESFGIEIHRGLAKTGIVGVVHGKVPGNRAIGLRADMDALEIEEANTFTHRSQHPGKMHACGHDGHSAMLLGAAKHLAENPDFAGTVYLIFQPAEENEGGARVMIEDGLFDRFSMEAVYGMHNAPGIAVGELHLRDGPMLASLDIFDIDIQGKGAHAAEQTICSRNIDPVKSAVLSVTQVHGGDTYNVIPDKVVVRGTVRTFEQEIQDQVQAAIRRTAEHIGHSFGAAISVNYERRYPPLVNHTEQVELCRQAAVRVFGDGNVCVDTPMDMGSDDFAFMLQAVPGCYVYIGNGEGSEGGCMVHNPNYDFNDNILSCGASYWVMLVDTILSR